MQEIYCYIDDSGVLHYNSGDDYFIYAGYVFANACERDAAARRYVEAEHKIYSGKRELKACRLKPNKRAFLNGSLRDCEAMACAVQKARVYN